MTHLIGIQEIIDPVENLRLPLVRDPPLDKIAALYLAQRILMEILLFKVRHPPPHTELNLPAGKVAVDERISRMDKTCSDSKNAGPAGRRDLFSYPYQGKGVDKVLHPAIVHNPPHSVLCYMRRHHLRELFTVEENIFTVYQSVRRIAFKDQLSDLFIDSGVTLDDQNVVLFITEVCKEILNHPLRKDLTIETFYDSFREFLIITFHPSPSGRAHCIPHSCRTNTVRGALSVLYELQQA